jgi:hypothetical protein
MLGTGFESLVTNKNSHLEMTLFDILSEITSIIIC